MLGYVIFHPIRQKYFRKFGPAPIGRGTVAECTDDFFDSAKYRLTEYIEASGVKDLCGVGFELFEICIKPEGDIA